MALKTVKCPNCAGELQVILDRRIIKCTYCGSEIVTNPVGDSIEETIISEKERDEYNKAKEYIDTIVSAGRNLYSEVSGDDGLRYFDADAENEIANCLASSGKITMSDKTSINQFILDYLLKDEQWTKKWLTTYEKHSELQLKRYATLLWIYLINPQHPIGLVAKAYWETRATNNPNAIKDYYSEAFKDYEKALKYSDFDRQIVGAILNQQKLKLSSIGFYLTTERVAQDIINFFNKIESLINVFHKFIPEDRPLEKYTVSALLDDNSFLRYHDEKEAIERIISPFIQSLEKEIIKVDKNYAQKYKPKSGCFIATTVYGSPMATEVSILREFRNEYLEATEWGKTFIKYYYIIGPHIARFISKRQFLRALTRQLLKPVIFTVKKYYRGNK